MKVYKEINFRLSTKIMSDLMYAIIITKARLISSFCLCYEYNRSQNSYNNASIIIEIEENKIDKFIY